jgi:hypothetical protein
MFAPSGERATYKLTRLAHSRVTLSKAKGDNAERSPRKVCECYAFVSTLERIDI